MVAGFTAENAENAEKKLKTISLRALRSGRLSKDLDRQGFVDIYKESMQ